MANFKGQIAVITGASSGIGKAIALRLAAFGTRLVLVGRNVNNLEAVAAQALVATDRVRYYQADLMLDKDIEELLAAIKQDYNQVDLLIHSAGTISTGRVEDMSVEELDRQYRVNVRAPYALTRGLLPALRSCQGQIVFINSSVSLMMGKAGLGQYAATKQALKALADSLRDEINGSGLRVLSVYPGRTASPMQAALHCLEGRVYEPHRLMQPEDVARAVVDALDLPRSAEITDISIRPMQK